MKGEMRGIHRVHSLRETRTVHKNKQTKSMYKIQAVIRSWYPCQVELKGSIHKLDIFCLSSMEITNLNRNGKNTKEKI